jgi:hypothetical protein
LWPLLEDENLLVVQQMRGKTSRKLQRIELSSGEIKDLYTFDKGWRVINYCFRENAGIKFAGKYHFLIHHPDLNHYKIIVIKDSLIDEVNIFGLTPGDCLDTLYHIEAMPLRYYIQFKSQIYLASQDGQIERVFSGDAVSVWKNRVLAIDKKGLNVFEIGEEARLLFRKEGKFRKGTLWNSWAPLKLVYIRHNNKPCFFDFETFQLLPADLPYRPFFVLPHRESYRVVGLDSEDYFWSATINQGELQPTKVWTPGIKRLKIGFFRSGIIVYNPREYAVYRFSDK